VSKGRRALPRRRVVGKRGIVLWGASGISAMVLGLGVSGTLSSWTSAVVVNDTNTTGTAKAVILQESSGANTCMSSDGAQTTVNSYSCSTINKYGGTTTLLAPGGAPVVTTVTFKNNGSANGTGFSLAPGACSQTPTAGSGTPAATNLCTSGDLRVAISCSAGSTYVAGSAWTDLVYPSAAPPTVTKTHTPAFAELNPNATWTCQVSVSLQASAPIAAQGIIVSQPLTWTLTG